MPLPLNRKNEGGIISSETFNLTRITTVLAGGVAGVTAISGAADGSGIDWAGFTRGQRLVLVVAAVAAIALISCADIMGRAVVSSKAANAPVQILIQPQPAKLKSAKGFIEGQVMALRPGAVTQVLFFGQDATPTTSWQNLDEVQLYQK